MRRRYCLIAILLAAPSVSAQPDQAPVFRAATRLVQVSVLVHDARGQPVSDLKKEDFTITERGKPQEISFFSMVSADAPAAPSATLPPDTFSNSFAQRAGMPTSVTVVLLDLLNTTWSSRIYAREELLKFLEQVQPQDHIGIFALERRGLTVLHDYTTDSASLVAGLKQARGEVPSGLDASTLNAETQDFRNLGLEALADGSQEEADFLAENSVVNTLMAFQAIAQHLSGLPGRKNLIWLSDGFPLTIGFDRMPEIGRVRDRRTFTQEMDAAVRALNNSGVAVYPVDARGLMVLPPFGAALGSFGSARNMGTSLPFASGVAGSIYANIDSMNELASRTGGRAAYNTNDLNLAIRQAIDDARVTYTIGYHSTDQAQDGKFRAITVKVNRPHLDVRYRKGYFALKPSGNTARTREDEIQAAAWSPLEATAIAMSARADFVELPAPNMINVILHIDPAAVGFRKQGEKWQADLDAVYIQKDEHGVPRNGSVTYHLSLALSDADYAKVLQEDVILTRRVARSPGAVTLRVVVRDVASGAVGSLTIPFSQIAGQ